MRPRPAAAVIFAAGAVAGVLDITAAFVTWHFRGDIAPTTILKGIASAILGQSAYNAGTAVAALGLALHFLIAFSAAAVFHALSRKFRFLVERPWLGGPIYGIGVYVFMYWVVLPLSIYHRRGFSLSATLIAIATHVVCVGLPIALVTAQRLRPRRGGDDAATAPRP